MNPVLKESLQESNLDYLVENNGFQFTDSFFPYTSGQVGSYYVQSGVVMNNRSHYHQACLDITRLVEINLRECHVDIIAGGESRDWMFSPVVANRLQKAHVMLYNDGRIVGADMKDRFVAIVSDLNNEGSSPRDKWIPAIQEAGGFVNHITFYVDRLEDGTKVMDELELKHNAVVELDGHAWDYLQQNGVVDSEVYQSLRERMEDKNAWAKGMLQSDKGLERLAELFDDSKTREKVLKIFRDGYPDLREGIAEGMSRFSRYEPYDISGKIWGTSPAEGEIVI